MKILGMYDSAGKAAAAASAIRQAQQGDVVAGTDRWDVPKLLRHVEFNKDCL